MADVRVVWDEAAVKLWADTDPQILAALDQVAAITVREIKRRAPVSPVTSGHSGHLRRSVHAFREGDGSIIIGPTAGYAKYVIDGTRPHLIRSHGPWPLRNRGTGQVFGPVVHHPGTRPHPFVDEAIHAISAMHLQLRRP